MTGTQTKVTLTHKEAKEAIFQYLREVQGLGLPQEHIDQVINMMLRMAGMNADQKQHQQAALGDTDGYVLTRHAE